MPANKNPAVHVLPTDKGWAVKVEGSTRNKSNHDTKQEAVDSGKAFAQKQKTEFVIHGKDGKIQNKNSYGNDPFPPRDKKR